MRRVDVETVFLKAMAETGQVKLYGEHPTLTETSLYRARRHLFKEERLKAEQERLERTGKMAYNSEWVKAWKRDTSLEVIQKHFEEAGEDENAQLIEMFCNQRDREYRIMMETDTRIRRDPLAMRMREDQIKPSIMGWRSSLPKCELYSRSKEVIDYRGPDFHEPTPNMLAYLKEHGKIITKGELEKFLAREKIEELKDEEEDGEEEEKKIKRDWSVLKSTPQLRMSKFKPKKEDPMSLEVAVTDSEELD